MVFVVEVVIAYNTEADIDFAAVVDAAATMAAGEVVWAVALVGNVAVGVERRDKTSVENEKTAEAFADDMAASLVAAVAVAVVIPAALVVATVVVVAVAMMVAVTTVALAPDSGIVAVAVVAVLDSLSTECYYYYLHSYYWR